MMSTPHQAARCGTARATALASLLGAAVVAGLLATVATPALTALTGTGLRADLLDEAVLVAVAAAGILGAGWYALSALALLVATSPRPEAGAILAACRRWGAPGLRRIAATTAIAGLGLGLSTSAVAAPAPSPVPDDIGWGSSTLAPEHTETGPTDTTGTEEPDAAGPEDAAGASTVATVHAEAPRLLPHLVAGPTGPAPKVPAAAQAPTGTPRATVLPEPEASHTVRAGDTLWELARATLPADASDARIAAEWQRWYAANRAVIGADPDLLLPGQQLVRPTDS